MAYPTGMLSITLEDIDRQIVLMKSQVQTVRTASAAGDLASSRILDLWLFLKNQRLTLSAAAATPGIGPYAQQVKDLPNLDVVTEFNNLLATMDAVTGWIEANFPKDPSGFLLSQTFGASGLVDRAFTTAQLATFRTQLDALLGDIA